MQRQHIKNGGCTLQNYIKIVNNSAGLGMLEVCELGLEEVWERECNSDSDVDEVLLTMNRSCHLATGSVSSHLCKEF